MIRSGLRALLQTLQIGPQRRVHRDGLFVVALHFGLSAPKRGLLLCAYLSSVLKLNNIDSLMFVVSTPSWKKSRYDRHHRILLIRLALVDV